MSAASEGIGAGWLCAANGIARSRTRKGRWVVKGRLPEEWDQAVAGLAAVFVVTMQVFREKGFFVEEAPDDDGVQRRKEKQRPIGAEGERDKGEHDQGGGIHGMANEAIGAGGDDFLIGRDFDGGRGEGVLAEDEEEEVEAEGDEEVGRDGEEGRDGGPVKRRSSPGNATSRTKKTEASDWTIFWLRRFSAAGPARRRRSMRLGSRLRR